MSAYSDVLAWSQTLPIWQRDVLRRLATQALLTAEEIDQLMLACMAEANQQVVEPPLVPIDETHVPADASDCAAVALVAVGACKSLNAIPDGQSLTFEPTGLTIIYGDNGTGKSGYARVLRNACHARGVAEQVLPDVYVAVQGSPEARVDYIVNGEPRAFLWNQGGASPPDDLRAVAVFDTGTASTLIEKENEVLWTPGGLDLLVRLVVVVDEVQDRLQRAATEVSGPGRLPQVPTATSAAAFLSSLSARTSTDELNSVVLKPEEKPELKRLDTALAAKDPVATSAQLRQRAQRFRALRERIALLEAGLGDAALRELATMHAAYREATDAEALLAQRTFGDSQLPGVGRDPWRALWDAAEKYARSGATPDGSFPSSTLPGLCVLCEQPLAAAARDRLGRFHSFVRADVAQTRALAADKLRTKLEGMRALRVREPADGALLEEMTDADPQNGKNLAHVLDAADATVMAVGALDVEAKEWHLPDSIPTGSLAWLDSSVAEIEMQATAMVAAANASQRAASEARRNELVARQALGDGRQLVEAELKRLVRKDELEKALATCSTTGITRKAGDLTRVYVSERLVKAFEAEASSLRLPVTVKYRHSRNEKGTSYQRVILEAASWAERNCGPVRVLSEGERRAVALAAFLAELATREDRSGVVLDDPVSSLDHERRHIVAKRLVSLAAERQVVVFTHDLVFLHMLKAASDEAGVGVTDREVRRTSTSSGVCRDKPPVKAMRIKLLVGELKERHQSCATAHSAGSMDDYEAQLTNTFGLLREGWERAVEELLLNQAVMRFDHRVQTQRLKNLHDITQADLDEIEAGMTVCSKWLPGHALAPAMNEPLPEPGDLLAEIQRLEGFVQAMRKRGRS